MTNGNEIQAVTCTGLAHPSEGSEDETRIPQLRDRLRGADRNARSINEFYAVGLSCDFAIIDIPHCHENGFHS